MDAILMFFAAVVSSAGPAAVPAQPVFDEWFIPKTLRVDLYHSGNDREDVYSFDQLVEEPVWAGSRKTLLDPTGYGCAQVRVYDRVSRVPTYSRGFCTVFGEWQTTDEAKTTRRTFHESLLVPMPKKPADVVIAVRQKDWTLKETFSLPVDPSDYRIARKNRFKHLKVYEPAVNGPPEGRVDVVMLGDGYTHDEMPKFRRDVDRFVKALFDTPPFRENKARFNVRAVESPSRESGVWEPRKGIWKDTALGLTFNTFDIERYMTTVKNRTMRDVAGIVPYDFVFIMANTSRYGGGGIFGLYATFPSDNDYDDYVFVHEFGHSFGGLADEYYTSAVAYSDFYPKGIEPWEPNLTAFLDKPRVKWGKSLSKDAPLPTPSEKKFGNTVGVFEGAGYAAKDLFRPSLDCKMFSKGNVPFCPVCASAIETMIGLYSDDFPATKGAPSERPAPTTDPRAELDTRTYHVAVKGDVVFSASTGALTVWDASDPKNVKKKGALYLDGSASHVQLDGNTLYLSAGPNGAWAVDVSDSANPKQIGHLKAAGAAMMTAVSGKTLFVADGVGGLAILDVSKPAAIKKVGAVPSKGYSRSVLVDGKTLYLGDGQGGLRVFNIASPKAPKEIASIPLKDQAREMVVVDGRLFVAAGTEGLLIFDLKDPKKPVELGRFKTGDTARGVFINGTLAYVADGNDGIRIINVADPKKPVEVGALETDYSANKITIGPYNFGYI
ncbi:MAG: hypothetical protein HY897_18720, partial [Deltaproteobacteria bacterium]|nr:hypothetical protein [Deltaproteobacteria bacterium]